MLRFEREGWATGYHRIAGVDEAGRGPLAGPVVAAAVCISRDFLENQHDKALQDLNDSKQLTPARREFFFELLMHEDEIHVGVGQSDVEEIDRINILQATHQAMRRSLAELRPAPDYVLIDGRPVPDIDWPTAPIIKGDAQSLSIAAASVIAKVTRDRAMLDLDRLHPGYGFARHKGYATGDHLRALQTLGPSGCHRRSFRPVRERMQQELL